MNREELKKEFESRVFVVNLRNLPNMEDGLFYKIDRSGPLGNPFIIGRDGTREEVIRKYEEWFREAYMTKPRLRIAFNGLFSYLLQFPNSKVYLGCWCYPKPCHGDVLKKLIVASCVNSILGKEKRGG